MSRFEDDPEMTVCVNCVGRFYLQYPPDWHLQPDDSFPIPNSKGLIGIDLRAGERFQSDTQSVWLYDDDGDVVYETGRLCEIVVLGGEFRVSVDDDGELFVVMPCGDPQQGCGYGPDACDMPHQLAHGD